MKVRLIDNSIRFRLRKSDVRAVQEKPHISVKLEIPATQSLNFCLKTNQTFQISHIAGTVVVSIPKIDFRKWVQSDDVSLKYELPCNKQEIKLTILIEKDFPCNDGEVDYNDTFFELQQEKSHC